MECVFESVELHSRAVLIDSQVEVSQSLNLQEAQRLESKTLSQVQDKSMVIGFPSLQPDADKPADHERVRAAEPPNYAVYSCQWFFSGTPTTVQYKRGCTQLFFF